MLKFIIYVMLIMAVLVGYLVGINVIPSALSSFLCIVIGIVVSWCLSQLD